MNCFLNRNTLKANVAAEEYEDEDVLQATGMIDLSEYENAEAWEAKMINLIPDYEKVNWDFLGQTWSISSTGVGPLVNLLLVMALFFKFVQWALQYVHFC